MLKQYLIIMCLTVFSFSAVAEEAKAISSEKTFGNFAGKVTGTKVRLRLQPDLDSPIIRQLEKNDLLLVVGETDNFFAIQPPSDFKGYVFKSYVIGNVIEANRVNLRLKPDMESPIIGQLNHNDTIKATPCPSDPKWLEMSPPSNVRLYVAKEYIEKTGSSDYYFSMIKRKDEASRLMNSAYFLTQAECKKPFNEMTPAEAVSQFEAILKGYKDFPEMVQQAKEGLALLQDNYLQKKIVFLESKAQLAESEKAALFEKFSLSPFLDAEPEANVSADEATTSPAENFKNLSQKMSFWKPVEDGLFQTWATFNPGKSRQHFYQEQEVNATVVCGVLESYDLSLKNKPGNFVLKKDNTPVAYLYSTAVDLDKYIGKEVRLKVSPRGNNNFAFPAYFVNAVQ